MVEKDTLKKLEYNIQNRGNHENNRKSIRGLNLCQQMAISTHLYDFVSLLGTNRHNYNSTLHSICSGFNEYEVKRSPFVCLASSGSSFDR